ncbi:hypothetical protein [Pontibacter chitinilyticus]|uniref:hypothetical protein n=1 Tax=Pontibacter chitinilyticus TaxID=2674989 RepID=UPI00321C24F6
MKDSSSKWKDFLLKSSVPLEYEVKRLLDNYGCLSTFEYTYLRKDENQILNEFSYDIDASFIKGSHFFELMIECKYRDPSTNWIFTPENYEGFQEVKPYSFINPVDAFTDFHKFRDLEYEPLAPLCGKGIEITSDGQNPKTISQAIYQLSYAMAEKVVIGMEHQYEKLLGNIDMVFYPTPIIVTTANLFRLKENVSIEDIKKSKSIDEISTKEDCLILNNNTGKSLEDFNLKIFDDFISKYGRENLNKKLKSFNKDIEFVCSVFAKNYCPSAIAIIHFSELNTGFKKLFNFFEEIIKPSERTLKRLEEKNNKLKEMSEKFEALKQNKNEA